LGKIDIGEFFDRLGFNHHFVIHDDVHDVGVGAAQTLIGDIQVNFPEGLRIKDKINLSFMVRQD
jgi:hypothetical protein